MAASILPEAGNRNGAPLRVGDWLLDPARNEVSRGAETVRLEPKVIEVLAYLARRPAQVVGRDELLSAVWPGVVVGDDALTQAIIKLRKALGDDAHKPRYIETISKRGYRLIGAAAPNPPPRPMRNGVRSVVAGAAALTLAAAIGFYMIARNAGMPWPLAPDTKGGAVATSFPVVAVMPLSNLSGDPKRDYFSDGVTEDIIAALGRFSGVRVMSRNAVQPFKGRSASPEAIRKELGARYIVEGSVREAQGRLRVAVQLSDADKGALLWSERYEAEGAQLFEVQDRIVRNIVGVLAVKLSRLEQGAVFTKPTESLEAYDMVLRARSMLDRNERSANREARELLARAQALAPDYPDLLAALGDAEFERVRYGWVEDAEEATRRAEGYAMAALRSADSRSHIRAHTLLASIYSHRNRFDDALTHAERAIELNASDSSALFARGMALLYIGRIDEAIAANELARRFEPAPSASTGINTLIAYYAAGRYAEAGAYAVELLQRTPGHIASLAVRAAALAQLGNEGEARVSAEQVRRFSPLFEVENFGGRFADPKYTAKMQEGLRKAGL